MRVTIILDSGGFLINDSAGVTHLDVGYFESAGKQDIEVSEDGKPAQPLPNVKLGDRNETIDVEHIGADGKVKAGVKQSQSFRDDILKKNELYPVNTPDFKVSEYDCILRFHSGDFESFDVRPRVFKEHLVRGNAATGNRAADKTTRPVANDVLVQFDLKPKDELRLRTKSGANLWSSSSVSSGTQRVEVKLLADGSLDAKYFQRALGHKGQHYHSPNPDPPPMDGNRINGALTS